MGVRAWRWGLFAALLALLAACGNLRAAPVTQIALLAPFEGRYQEIGYNALYAARLAIDEAGRDDLTLLAVDDGGTASTAMARARVLATDARVAAVLALGYPATAPDVLAAFQDVPVFMVGYWGAAPTPANVFAMTPSALADVVDFPRIDINDAAARTAPLVIADVGSLAQFPSLRDDLAGMQVVSAGELPTAEFRERYLASDLFVPEPGLIATQTYDATRYLLAHLDGNTDRASLMNTVAPDFENGYFVDARVHLYVFDADDVLVPAGDNVIE